MSKLRTQAQRNNDTKPGRATLSLFSRPGRAFHKEATEEEGAQLLEFALVLPFLLVFLIGIIEFGGAFTLKQKMANAAREGTRIMVSNSTTDFSCGSSVLPCSVQWAAGAVAKYMTNDGQNSSCISPAAPTSSGIDTWTYTCPNGISLTINHSYVYYSAPPGGGTPVPVTGTQVTLTYPYSWFFNNVIKLLVPGSTTGLPARLTESSVMQNIAN